MKSLKHNFNHFYTNYIAPRSSNPDQQRRELILNILLSGFTFINILSCLSAISTQLQGNGHYAQLQSIIALLVFLLLIIGLWKLSRKGFYIFSSYALLFIGLLGATELLLTWSFELPMTQLVLAVLVVMAGVLLTARSALRVTFGLCVYVLFFSYLETYGHIKTDTKWLNQKPQMVDSVGLVIALLLIGLVSWLANRETDRSLDRARHSEAALELERDQLEVKVIERTRQLEQAQQERLMELQKLAEFGQMSAGLLHDVADPLTVASLNLQELGNKSQSLLVRRAMQNLQYIERFLVSARMQLESHGEPTEFLIVDEIKRVISILKHRARQAEVSLKLNSSSHQKIYGDPVKFNQIIANLILNAIEAYEQTPLNNRVVNINVENSGDGVIIKVTDHGSGLTRAQIKQIFEPFYTTKADGHSNMGIGLATVKKLVEGSFGGRLKVTSSKVNGTCFTVYLSKSASND